MIHEKISSLDAAITLPSMASLLAFEAAARHGSFAGAAQELGRTPSAVSHAIRDLEVRLNALLFERAGRAVRITNAGAEYLISVQSALEVLQSATRRFQRRSDDHVIRISALPFFASAVLLPNLSRFESENPQIELRIETSSSYVDILNGEADIAIRFGREHVGDLICKPLISITGQPIASPDYLASSPPIATAKDLDSHTLIHVRANRNAWQTWAEAHDMQALSGQSSLTFDSILGAIDAVKSGLGIALSMAPLIETYPGYGQSFVPVLGPVEDRNAVYNFICHRNKYQDRKIQRTLEWLESSIGFQKNTS